MKKIPKKGTWIMTIKPILTEIACSPLTLFFAKPYKINYDMLVSEWLTNAKSQSVKVKTKSGVLVLHEGEYNLIDINDFLPHLGNGLDMVTFSGNSTKNIVKEQMFYLRSRGINKQEAIKMIASCSTHDFSNFCYFSHNKECQKMYFDIEELQPVWEREIL